MKIYVASSWRNEYQQNVVKFLRELGHILKILHMVNLVSLGVI